MTITGDDRSRESTRYQLSNAASFGSQSVTASSASPRAEHDLPENQGYSAFRHIVISSIYVSNFEVKYFMARRVC